MGPNSTTRVVELTGPPLTGTGLSPLSNSTFHFMLLISDLSWFVDKLVSFTSSICSENCSKHKSILAVPELIRLLRDYGVVLLEIVKILKTQTGKLY